VDIRLFSEVSRQEGYLVQRFPKGQAVGALDEKNLIAVFRDRLVKHFPNALEAIFEGLNRKSADFYGLYRIIFDHDFPPVYLKPSMVSSPYKKQILPVRT
jgi:hypothetical protein